MDIAALVLGVVANLTKAGMEAYAASKLDGEAAKKRMLDAIEEARLVFMTWDTKIAANDAAADAAAAKKPSAIPLEALHAKLKADDEG